MKASEKSDESPIFEKYLNLLTSPGDSYSDGHRNRFLHTLKYMPLLEYVPGGNVIELGGGSPIFPVILSDVFGYTSIDTVIFEHGDSRVKKIHFQNDPVLEREFLAYDVDLDMGCIPVDSGDYDLCLAFEVLEHMERDPMNMLSEVNRILKTGGLLYLSTPNIISSRNVYKILHSYAPHFFMKYSKTHSLYRHNIEYAPNQLLELTSAAGFKVRKFWTFDTFEEPIPEIIEFLESNNFNSSNRGDNMFVICEKVSPVVDRYPSCLYF